MSRISHKEFMSAVLQRIRDFETRNYKNLIVRLALNKSSSARTQYINFLDEILADDADQCQNIIDGLRDLEVNQDVGLIEEVQALYDKVQDGDYDGDWEWDPEYREERMVGNESWAGETSELFLRTRDVYRVGNYEAAVKSYEMLFSILCNDQLAGDSDNESMLQIDMDEQRNLYIHAIYMYFLPKDRPAKILEALSRLGYGSGNEFRIKDMFNKGKLPEYNEFLKAWIKELYKSDFYFRSNLIKEAVYLDGGIEGLKEHARKSFKVFPELYLEWVIKLEENEANNDKIIEACKEALTKVPEEDKIRDSIAKVMIKAAEGCNNVAVILEGIKEAFNSNPNIENMVLMIDYSNKYNADTNEKFLFMGELLINQINLHSAHAKAGNSESVIYDAKRLLHKIYILSGKFENAFEMGLEESKSIPKYDSWFRPAEIFTPFMKSVIFLLILKDNKTYFDTINRLWDDQLNITNDEDIKRKFSEQVQQAIHKSIISEQEKAQYISWCIEVTKRRVNEIVSNQIRGAYDDAAIMLVACAEMIANVEGEEKAYELVNMIKGRYPRHISFLKSLNSVLKDAKISQKFI